MATVFVESAFRHGYDEEDFYEVLASRPFKVRSRRGLGAVYELYGCNYAGDYLHVAYRRVREQTVVFHMRRMTAREKQLYRKLR
jgi:hypothetical protein